MRSPERFWFFSAFQHNRLNPKMLASKWSLSHFHLVYSPAGTNFRQFPQSFRIFFSLANDDTTQAPANRMHRCSANIFFESFTSSYALATYPCWGADIQICHSSTESQISQATNHPGYLLSSEGFRLTRALLLMPLEWHVAPRPNSTSVLLQNTKNSKKGSFMLSVLQGWLCFLHKPPSFPSYLSAQSAISHASSREFHCIYAHSSI